MEKILQQRPMRGQTPPLVTPKRPGFKDILTLPQEYHELNADLIFSGLWKWVDPAPRIVIWKPWRAWGPSRYGMGKLHQLRSWYVDHELLVATCELIKGATRRKEWSSVAMHLGDSSRRAKGFSRYKLGQCLNSVVFRFTPTELCPSVVWRTCESGRRLIADFVLLDNLFRHVCDNTGLALGPVTLNLNLVWFANFHGPLLEKWMPGLKDLRPEFWKRFRPTKLHSQYAARDRAWRLAREARQMFTPIDQGGRLLKSHVKSDFPRIEL